MISDTTISAYARTALSAASDVSSPVLSLEQRVEQLTDKTDKVDINLGMIFLLEQWKMDIFNSRNEIDEENQGW